MQKITPNEPPVTVLSALTAVMERLGPGSVETH